MAETTAAITIQDIAEAMLARDDMRLRILVQAWLRDTSAIGAAAQPATHDPRVLSAAAALLELFALRAHEPPPEWAQAIGPLPEPFFVMAWAERPGFTRDLCLAESPEPLKRRNIFSPPNFLEMA